MKPFYAKHRISGRSLLVLEFIEHAGVASAVCASNDNDDLEVVRVFDLAVEQQAADWPVQWDYSRRGRSEMTTRT